MEPGRKTRMRQLHIASKWNENISNHAEVAVDCSLNEMNMLLIGCLALFPIWHLTSYIEQVILTFSLSFILFLSIVSVFIPFHFILMGSFNSVAVGMRETREKWDERKNQWCFLIWNYPFLIWCSLLWCTYAVAFTMLLLFLKTSLKRSNFNVVVSEQWK